MKKIILIGAGTFSTVVIDAILENPSYKDYEITGFLDDGEICSENFDYPLLGKVDDIPEFTDNNTFFIISIGSPAARKKISERYPYINYLTLIDKSANISKFNHIGKGCIILKNTSINTFAQIDDFVIINTGAIIDHHCEIGRCSHIGHGAILWHSAKIKECEHLLPGTVVKG